MCVCLHFVRGHEMKISNLLSVLIVNPGARGSIWQEIDCVATGLSVHFFYRTVEYDDGGEMRLYMFSPAGQESEALPPAAAWTEKVIAWPGTLTGSPVEIQFLVDPFPPGGAIEAYVDDVRFV